MEDKRIKVVKQWPKPKLVKDIQVFLRFANFYWQFIQGINCITAPPTLILKIIKNTGFVANPKETKSEADGNNIVGNSMVGGGKATNQINFTKNKTK